MAVCLRLDETDALRADFIAAMRGVDASVTVVTTDGPAGRHGATVSAFSSVSADPPSALVCLHGRSRIAGTVCDNGAFCVNVLPRGRDDIARRFAGAEDGRVADRFEGVALAPGALPRIEGAATFSCMLSAVIPHGTHLICIGRVTRVAAGAPTPLTYLNGAYCDLAPREAE